MTFALAWTPFAFVVTVALWRAWQVLSGLIEWEDTDATGTGRKLTIGGTTAVTILTFGALAYGFGAGAGALTTLAKAVGVGSAPAVGAPNAPAITATVYRTQGDSLWVDGGTFAGSGSDTHAQTYIWIDTTGGTFSPPKYHGDTIGAIERDSIGGNLAALDSGAVVDIIMAYEGTSGGWSAPDTLTGVVMTATMSFAFSINDMDNAGISGDTLVVQGFPMPEGAIDTAHVVDSVEVLVNGAEVGAYVEHRGLAYSDGSARVIFTQFRANPATESAGELCYSGCTVDSVRIAEQSWTTTDTAFAQINAGDSTGHKTGSNGYHPVMAFATDSAWLADAYFYPLATIEEVQAITGVLADATDTIFKRAEDYANVLWDGTASASITGEGPSWPPYTDIVVTTDTSEISGCTDWTVSTNSFANWRQAAGQANNATCRSGHNYYDYAKTHQQLGIMRSADATGVEFLRRSFAIDWQDLMYFTDRGSASCIHGEVNRRPIPTGMLGTYFFTGDSTYAAQIKCQSDWYTTGARVDDFGNDAAYQAGGGAVAGGEGEPRIIAFQLDIALAAHILGYVSAAKVDSMLVWAIHGRASGPGASPSYGGGTWALDSVASGCTSPYNENARPTNSLMIPLVVNTLLRAKRVTGKDTIVVGTDTTNLPTIFQAVADTMTYNAGMWVEAEHIVRNYTTAHAANCDDPSAWTTINLDIQGVHAVTLYADYVYDKTTASLAEADTMVFKLTYDSVSTVSYDFLGGFGNGANSIRDFIVSEHFNTIPEAFGWRQCTLEDSC